MRRPSTRPTGDKSLRSSVRESPRDIKHHPPKPCQNPPGTQAPRADLRLMKSSRRVRPGLAREIMAVAEDHVNLALLVDMFARRGAGSQRRQTAGLFWRAWLPGHLALRLPARKAFGMARQIVERLFERADAAQEACVSSGSSRSGTRWVGETSGGEAGEPTCAEPLAPCPSPATIPQPAKVLRREPFQRVDEAKGREDSSSSKAFLSFQPSPAGNPCVEPSRSLITIPRAAMMMRRRTADRRGAGGR